MQQKIKTTKLVLKWQNILLLQFAKKWINRLRTKKISAPENSSWWIFIYNWRDVVQKSLIEFIKGGYSFDPMITHNFENETIIIWDYRDRLIVKWIHNSLTP